MIHLNYIFLILLIVLPVEVSNSDTNNNVKDIINVVYKHSSKSKKLYDWYKGHINECNLKTNILITDINKNPTNSKDFVKKLNSIKKKYSKFNKLKYNAVKHYEYRLDNFKQDINIIKEKYEIKLNNPDLTEIEKESIKETIEYLKGIESNIQKTIEIHNELSNYTEYLNKAILTNYNIIETTIEQLKIHRKPILIVEELEKLNSINNIMEKYYELIIDMEVQREVLNSL